jgi:hypothetical protein
MGGTVMEEGDRVVWQWYGGEHPGNGFATVIAVRPWAWIPIEVKLDATGERMLCPRAELTPMGKA